MRQILAITATIITLINIVFYITRKPNIDPVQLVSELCKNDSIRLSVWSDEVIYSCTDTTYFSKDNNRFSHNGYKYDIEPKLSQILEKQFQILAFNKIKNIKSAKAKNHTIYKTLKEKDCLNNNLKRDFHTLSCKDFKIKFNYEFNRKNQNVFHLNDSFQKNNHSMIENIVLLEELYRMTNFKSHYKIKNEIYFIDFRQFSTPSSIVNIMKGYNTIKKQARKISSINEIKLKLYKKLKINDKNEYKSKTKIRVGLIDDGIDSFNKAFSSNSYKTIPRSGNDHGNHVSGVIYLLTNNIEIVMYKLDIDEMGTHSIAQGVNYLLSKNVDVISMSIGGSKNASLQEFRAFKKAEKRNIPIIVAAGNEGEIINSNEYPYNYNVKNILVVGSSNSKDKISSFSNIGGKVDIYALGEKIPSFCLYSDDTCIKTGTSQAVPIVTSAVIRLMQVDKIRNIKGIRDALRNNINKEKIFKYNKFTNRNKRRVASIKP